MNRKPTPTDETAPAYPNRREFIKQFGLIAAGAGLGAMAVPPAEAKDLRGDPKIEPKVGKAKASVKFCAKTCGKQIDTQVKLLNNDDFKIRKQATKSLIEIGKGEGKDKAVAAKQRELVLKKMEALKKAKDPEISQRAKAIVLALNPPKKIRPAPRHEEMVDGGMVIEID